MKQIKKIIILATMGILLVGCSKSNEQITINSLTQALMTKGMKVSDKQEKMFQLLMATDGYAVNIDGENIEIYQFDTTIKSGEEALNKWIKEGFMGQKVITHKNLLLFQKTNHKKWNDIINVLNEL